MKKNTLISWEKAGMESPLATFVKFIYPINDDIVDYINKNTFSLNISKGHFLLKTGEVCRHLYLIRKGVIRAFIKDGSKEITTWITSENEIVTSIRGFNQQLPSLENMQSIEDCSLVCAQYETLQYLYDHYPEMNIVARKILEQYYGDAEERAFISRIPNASKRYKHFIETKGDLANRIPLKYIASYLGMTLETLSRIRGKKL
jgi:CRP-like cAMP-binding protein